MTALSLRPPTACEVAEHMSLDAAFYRALAAEARANPHPETYGDRAQDYAEGIAARYEVIAAFVEHEARKLRLR